MAYYGGGLNSVIQNFEYWGLSDVLLPFILVFTLVFAILQKVNILGDPKKTRSFHVVIALVMGLGVVIPHVMGLYPSPESDIVNIINGALPQVSIVLVGILMAILIIGLFGGEANWGGGKLGGYIAIGAFLLIAFIFGRSAGWFAYGLPNWLVWLDDPDTQAMLLVIGVFALIIWYITKEDKPDKKGVFEGVRDDFHQFFTPKGGK